MCKFGYKHSEETKKKIRDKRIGYKHSEETKIKMRGRKVWNEGLTKETSKKLKEISSKLKGIKRSDETKQKISESRKIYIGEKHPFYGKKHSEESKQKMRKSLKGRDVWNKNLNYKIDNRILFDENHPNWQGGKSFEEYCPIFKDKEWREILYERDKNNCQICGCSKQLNFKLHGNKNLSIHHIDHNKMNCHPNNCLLVCPRCNVILENKKTKKVYEYLIQMKMKIEKGYSYI